MGLIEKLFSSFYKSFILIRSCQLLLKIIAPCLNSICPLFMSILSITSYCNGAFLIWCMFAFVCYYNNRCDLWTLPMHLMLLLLHFKCHYIFSTSHSIHLLNLLGTTYTVKNSTHEVFDNQVQSKTSVRSFVECVQLCHTDLEACQAVMFTPTATTLDKVTKISGKIKYWFLKLNFNFTALFSAILILTIC